MKNNFFKSLISKEYFLAIFKVVLIVTFLIVSFNYLKSLNFFSSVSTEILITTAAAFFGAVWKFYTDKEKLKIKDVKEETQITLKALRTLDLRVDSVLVQLQDIRSSQYNDSEEIEKLNQRIDQLNKNIIDSRNQLLTERIELIIEFYKEIGLINNHISMNRNHQSEMLDKTLKEQEEFNKN